jgi:hypothetical protein
LHIVDNNSLSDWKDIAAAAFLDARIPADEAQLASTARLHASFLFTGNPVEVTESFTATLGKLAHD